MSEDRSGCGPKEGKCAVCGEPIGEYESRWYSNDGRMACKWRKGTAVLAGCRTTANAREFPHYYTDG